MSDKHDDPIRAAVQTALQDAADTIGVSPTSIARVTLHDAGETIGVEISNEDQQQPDDPFVFYHAEPVKPTPQQREEMIAQLMSSEPSLLRDVAEKICDSAGDDMILLSSQYQVAIRLAESGFQNDVLHLSIKRIDREPIHDWRVLQQIKNAIVGDECEAFELYPAESRLVDTANQYHLWAFTDQNVRVPVGFTHRFVDVMPVGKSQQRQFTAPDALMPSKAQLSRSLRNLYEWIESRDVGTLTIVKDEARSLIAQIDRVEGMAKQVSTASSSSERKEKAR